MRIIICLVFSVLTFTYAAHAQRDEGLTWDELKATQENERTALLNKQDSEFRVLIAVQKSQIALFSHKNAPKRKDLWKQLIEERKAAMQRYAEERKAQAEIHAKERIEYNKKPPDSRNQAKL